MSRPDELPVTEPRSPAGGHDPHTDLAGCLHELAGVAGDRAETLAAGLAALAELQRQLDAARTSLRIAEESVVRQQALLETATALLDEARRWARSLSDDGPASEEPVILNEPEFAPAWLTADGAWHTARRPRTWTWTWTQGEPAGTEHALRLAALDRLIADLEAEWGPITADDLATAARRLRDRTRLRADSGYSVSGDAALCCFGRSRCPARDSCCPCTRTGASSAGATSSAAGSASCSAGGGVHPGQGSTRRGRRRAEAERTPRPDLPSVTA
jgi:hypothetical protein